MLMLETKNCWFIFITLWKFKELNTWNDVTLNFISFHVFNNYFSGLCGCLISSWVKPGTAYFVLSHFFSSHARKLLITILQMSKMRFRFMSLVGCPRLHNMIMVGFSV